MCFLRGSNSVCGSGDLQINAQLGAVADGMADKKTISANLPLRRGLTEIEAAVYISLSPSFFRRLVQQGVMPRPRVAGRRRIWDIEELDAAFRTLPREGDDEAIFGYDSRDSWADYE